MLPQERGCQGLRRINAARDDISTIDGLIDKRLEQGKNEALTALKKQAGEVKKGLDNLEKLYTTPAKTKGIVYSGDTVNSKLGDAGFYAASAGGKPAPAADTYLQIARKSLAEAEASVDKFMAGDLAKLRESVDGAGIGLLVEP